MTLRISTVFLESLNRMHASQPSWFKLLLFGTRIAHLLTSYVICIAGETKREFTIQMALIYIYICIYKFYKILYIYLKCVFHWGIVCCKGRWGRGWKDEQSCCLQQVYPSVSMVLNFDNICCFFLMLKNNKVFSNLSQE